MQPVELKVKASTAAAAVSGVVLYVLGTYVFRGAVPDVIASWVYAIVPAVLTFAAGYTAKHTARPDTTAVDARIAAAIKQYGDAHPVAEPPPAGT